MKNSKILPIMGSIVVVTKIWRRIKEQHRDANGFAWHHVVRWVAEDCKPRPGWVIGCRNIRYGRIIPGGWEDPSVLKISGTHPAILVVYWPTMTPVKIPIDGYRIAQEHEQPYFDYYQWTNNDRQARSDDVKKHAKRDAKGRFVK